MIDITGQSKEKAAASDAMFLATLIVANGTSAYATVKADHVLLALVRFNRAIFDRASSLARARHCQAVLEATEPHLTNLADYGVNQARIDDLAAAIERYQLAMSAPRLTIIARKAATTRVAQPLKSCTRVLRHRLEGLMSQYAMSAPELHRDYFNAHRHRPRLRQPLDSERQRYPDPACCRATGSQTATAFFFDKARRVRALFVQGPPWPLASLIHRLQPSVR